MFRVLIFLLLCNHLLNAQTITVTDDSGTALPGVEVFSEDKIVGGVTDLNGQIVLINVDENLPIHYRYLGFNEIITTLSKLKEYNYNVEMLPSERLIEEVVVLGRKTVDQSEIPFQIKTISLEDIKSTNSQTAADALAQHGGVFVQKSQMGGGSPVIRGFEANRVLMVVDGIRLNNAIYRSGHLQNAITVDQAILDRMEVIFGPNSLMYGSDALGGVVNFRTINPVLASSSEENVSETNFYGRFASANQEKSGHIDFSFGKEKWGSLSSITYSNYGDLRTGNNRDSRYPEFGKRSIYQSTTIAGEDITIDNENPNVQIGTGYNQLDLFQKFWSTRLVQIQQVGVKK